MKKIIIFFIALGFFCSTSAQGIKLIRVNDFILANKSGEAEALLESIKRDVVGTDLEPKYYFLKGKNLFGNGIKKPVRTRRRRGVPEEESLKNITTGIPVFDKAAIAFYKVLSLEE